MYVYSLLKTSIIVLNKCHVGRLLHFCDGSFLGAVLVGVLCVYNISLYLYIYIFVQQESYPKHVQESTIHIGSIDIRWSMIAAIWNIQQQPTLT